MIGKLKGKVDSQGSDFLIIDVGGVGYKVFCSGKTLSNTSEEEHVTLYIETHVREDHIQLFGFLQKTEQIMFNTLQTVKGVGTRMALAILSKLAPEEVQMALASQDKAAFTGVSGVGRKLAERIITELKDHIAADISALSLNSLGSTDNVLNQGASIINDAVSALTSLGISRADAYSRVTNIMVRSPNLDINDVIRLALQNTI